MSCNRPVLLLLLLELCVAGVLAQTQNRPTSPDAPTHGTAQVFLTPSFVPRNLPDLVDRADVIVDASVETVLPSRWTDPARKSSLETDVLLSVVRVLKGPATAKIIVSQSGGKLGDLYIEAPQDPLMVTAERYILFLINDGRTNLPTYSLPRIRRYVVTGIWNGRFYVHGDHVNVGSLATSTLKLYDDKPLGDFTNEIASALSRKP